MQSMTASLCFSALTNTRMYIGMNSNPPVVSNKPRISNPINVVMSAFRFRESSFNPFLSSIMEIPRGPANNIKSNKIIEFSSTPKSLRASFRLQAIGAATAIIVNVAIILPEEEACSSLITSAMIMPIGTSINNVHVIFCARSSSPTEVSATVNRTIGPIRLILPRGPQE